MFRKLRLLYYNNKEKIWVILGICILIYVVIRLINNSIIKNNQENANNIQNISTTKQYTPSTTSPVITDSTISKNTLEEHTNIIEQFMEYGNSNNVEGAYGLLSQDCKDEMFSTIDRFYNNYFKDVFSEKRSYDMETWMEYNGNVTYRIKYLNDIMATGTINDEFIEDYFTVIEENGEKKLNINQFIDKFEMDEKGSVQGLDVSIIGRYTYYDYEQYEFVFTNNSEKQITIDSKDDTETVYIKDNNDIEYAWFGNEIPNEYLTLNPGESRTFRIKFNKLYNSERIDESVNFTDIKVDGENDVVTLKIGV